MNRDPAVFTRITHKHLLFSSNPHVAWGRIAPMTQAAVKTSLRSDQSNTLFSYPKYWAECYGTAPWLPMSRAEMDELGWDSCDIIIVTGDAYVDHPSFGMAIMGRLLEAQGFRVGIIAQPDW